MGYQQILLNPNQYVVESELNGKRFLELTDSAIDIISQEAYTRTCELESPNAPGYEALYDKILDDLCDQVYAAHQRNLDLKPLY